MTKKTNTITVNERPISILQADGRQNYISLTDMIKAYEPDPIRTDMIIGNWMRLKDTIDYLGIWETLNNPCFNPIEFDGIKTAAGSNRFILTAKDWQEANPELANKYNMRDTATINQLVVLSNLESANSEMIKQGISRKERYDTLYRMAQEQMELFNRSNAEHKFRKLLPGGDQDKVSE